jgi:hypothetical protein
MIDHAVLKPNFTDADVEKHAKMCVARGVKSMCVRPCDLPLTAKCLAGSKVLVSVVIGYVDHVVDLAAARLVPTSSRLAEAVRRRRIEASSEDVFVEKLLGLEFEATASTFLQTNSRQAEALYAAALEAAALQSHETVLDLYCGTGTLTLLMARNAGFAVGVEIVEQAAELGIHPDDVVVCCSGGGLVAGTALAVTAMLPTSRVWSAEPAEFDDHRRSLQAGQRLRNAPGARSICDALLAPTPGELTFRINRGLLAGGLTATDSEVRSAIAYAARVLKLVVEPGGAVALASVMAGRLETRGRTVAIVLSGGNIDDQMLRECLLEPPPPETRDV